MSRYALLAVAALVVLAGCAAAPQSPTTTTQGADETFRVELTGNSSATYLVSARLLADPVGSVNVTYANGSTRSVAVPAGPDGVTFGPDSGATSVDYGGEVAGGVHFEGSPVFSATDEGVAPTGTVVYTVRRPGERRLAAWGYVRCDGHVASLTLRADDAGIGGLGYGCAS